MLAALKKRAFEYRQTPCVARSHGIHAEPTTFGLKLASHYAEFVRARERLAMARCEIATCAISGPGRHLRLGRSARRGARGGQARPGGRADLHPGDPARPARGLLRGAGGGGRVDGAARHRDPPPAAHRGARGRGVFRAGQKGSSSMPHKRNPILTENLTGLARAGALGRGPGAGGRDALARARHQPLVGGARHRTGHHRAPRLRARRLATRGRAAGGLSAEHGAEPRRAGRPRPSRSACCWR